MDAAGSNVQQIEELTGGRVLTNLAIPFRWDNEDRVFGHGTDTIDFPPSSLQFPGGGAHSDAARLRSEFAIEMTLRVRQRPNGQFRNVFHLGNDEDGFAHVCMIETHTMKLIIGVAYQGETNPRTMAAGCTSNEEIFLDEDVLIVYSFGGGAASVAGTLYINGEPSTGCSFSSGDATTAEMRGKMFTPAADGSLPAERLHLILGDVIMSRHSIDMHLPGFYGDVSRIVLHEEQLLAANVFELYEPHCGKHLHGYYVESTLPPLVQATGGGGGIYDPDACEDECAMAKYLTMLMLGMACPCCIFFAFFFYEKPPMLDVAPEMMPTMGGGDSDNFELDMVTTAPPRKAPPPSLAALAPTAPAATSPARSRPPSLREVGQNVRSAQRVTRALTPERGGDVAQALPAPPQRTTAPPRRAAPSLESIAASTGAPSRQGLSPARRRDTRMPDLEETSTEHKANIRGLAAAFDQGQAPGASLHELKQAGADKLTIRTTSPQRTSNKFNARA